MPTTVNRLSAVSVKALTEPGRHADGNGLYLVVDKSGAKRWVYLFRDGGRLREMGLGGLANVSLADARRAAEAARKARAAGLDPIAARKAVPSEVPTFGKIADDLVDSLEPGFRNGKHVAQWRSTLATYAKDLRSKPVDQITTEDVLAALKPIWASKAETASRVRGRIERVLNAAKAQGHRSGENPAAWKDHLENLLPKRHRLTRGHHAAISYTALPAFLAELRNRPALAARALEFTILTAARTSETLGATWAEIDLEAAVWTVPGERMKAGRVHRVPLSAPALAILEKLAEAEPQPGDYLFPGNKRGRPLSGMSMEMVLRRMKMVITVHGFRSTFRDWCFEESDFPRELAEAALAHVVGDQTERAYKRGDALKKRAELMEAWARFCTGAAPATGEDHAREEGVDVFS